MNKEIDSHDDIIAWIENQTKSDLEAIKPLSNDYEYYTHVYNRYRFDSFVFLNHFDRLFHPQNILYPACGFDRIPKITFGKRLLHESLENHGHAEDLRYCSDLNGQELVISHNAHLPFKNQAFDTLLILDTAPSIILPYLSEFNRVLQPSGAIIVYDNFFTDNFQSNRHLAVTTEFGPQKYPVPYWYSSKDKHETDIYFTPHIYLKSS